LPFSLKAIPAPGFSTAFCFSWQALYGHRLLPRKNISLSDGHSIFADLLSVDYIVAKIFIVSRISKRMEIIKKPA
jgi:hypothetical protein